MIRAHLLLADNRLTVRNGSHDLVFDLRDFSRVVVLGAGKATARMALAAEQVPGSRLSEGFIAVELGHPVPDEASVAAGRRIYELCTRADERTLIINLISGVGSAHLTLPAALPDG